MAWHLACLLNAEQYDGPHILYLPQAFKGVDKQMFHLYLPVASTILHLGRLPLAATSLLPQPPSSMGGFWHLNGCLRVWRVFHRLPFALLLLGLHAILVTTPPAGVRNALPARRACTRTGMRTRLRAGCWEERVCLCRFGWLVHRISFTFLPGHSS